MARVLHLGQRKTGTSWLQEVAARTAAEGRLTLLHWDLAKRLSTVNARNLSDDDLRDIAAMLPQGEGPTLATHEGLLVLDPDRLAAMVAGAWPDARILVTTRAPEDYLASSFNNNSFGGRHGTAAEFAASFARGHMRLSHDLDRVARAYGEALGEGRVHFVPYELLRDDPDAYLAHLSRLIGADLAPQGGAAPVNVSPPAAFLALQRQFNAMVAARAPGIVETPEWRHFMVAANHAAGSAKGLDGWLAGRLRGRGDLPDGMPMLPEGALGRLAQTMTVLRDLPLYRPYLAHYGLGAQAIRP